VGREVRRRESEEGKKRICEIWDYKGKLWEKIVKKCFTRVFSRNL
jgi:hypothetical protein